jgi:hypothetical protein
MATKLITNTTYIEELEEGEQRVADALDMENTGNMEITIAVIKARAQEAIQIALERRG